MNDTNKLKMQTKNIVDENVEYIAKKFPNAVTETSDGGGNIVKKIDFDVLKQELSNDVLNDDKERYVLAWPGKKQAIVAANEPIDKTLRPCRDKSVNFDETKNLYFEGDNLEVLKLLRETYLGKIKMIYIDPPYNTGSDFVYRDNFAESKEEYLIKSEQIDSEGNQMIQNIEGNGRFHSDWLTMMYARLKVARDLMTENGVIFISIDDNEQANLKKICDSVFGEKNFVGTNIRKTVSQRAMAKSFNTQHEYCLIYCKNISMFDLKGDTKDLSNYSNEDKDPKGSWKSSDPTMKGSHNTFPITNPYTGEKVYPPKGRGWAFTEEKQKEYVASGRIVFKKEYGPKERGFLYKAYASELRSEYLLLNSLDCCTNDYLNQVVTRKENSELQGGNVFEYAKPVVFIEKLLSYDKGDDSIVMDFFSGSATTAHAVMQLNAKDGGHRKFIMIQIPEKCREGSDEYNAGYKNICELGEDRIKRAGDSIMHENPSVADSLDTGFRVLKLDSSNMEDVYYNPSEYTPDLFNSLEDNIKKDRTDEDLLFQVMLELGIMLDSKIEEKTIGGKKVFVVTSEDKTLVCCFDKDVTDDVVTEIAKSKPDYAVFRDSSMSSDSVAINFEQIFKTYSPSTIRKVL